MSEDEARRAVVALWLEKADQALAAARRELAAGDYSLTLNRVYYACFYAASAVLLHDKRHYVKHMGVKSAVHQYLVHPGRIPMDLGAFYEQAFKERNEADYETRANFTQGLAASRIPGAERFVAEMRRLLTEAAPGADAP